MQKAKILTQFRLEVNVTISQCDPSIHQVKSYVNVESCASLLIYRKCSQCTAMWL